MSRGALMMVWLVGSSAWAEVLQSELPEAPRPAPVEDRYSFWLSAAGGMSGVLFDAPLSSGTRLKDVLSPGPTASFRVGYCLDRCPRELLEIFAEYQHAGFAGPVTVSAGFLGASIGTSLGSAAVVGGASFSIGFSTLKGTLEGGSIQADRLAFRATLFLRIRAAWARWLMVEPYLSGSTSTASDKYQLIEGSFGYLDGGLRLLAAF